MNTTPTPPREIWRPRAISIATGYSIAAIHAKARDENDPFPALLELGPHAVGAFADEVKEYVESRPRTKPVETAEDGEPVAA